jgi:UDP-N-acetylglucosamine 4,6-dehydratase
MNGVDFVLKSFEMMSGGEIFIPKVPSCRLDMLADVVAPEVPVKVMGLRPGEKMHEILIPEDEAANTYEFKDRYVIAPLMTFGGQEPSWKAGKPCAPGFSYASHTNSEWFTREQLHDLCEQVAHDLGISIEASLSV